MKIISNQVRPVGYVTLELDTAELQCLYDLFWEVSAMHRRPIEDLMGKRGEIYQEIAKLIEIKQK